MTHICQNRNARQMSDSVFTYSWHDLHCYWIFKVQFIQLLRDYKWMFVFFKSKYYVHIFNVFFQFSVFRKYFNILKRKCVWMTIFFYLQKWYEFIFFPIIYALCICLFFFGQRSCQVSMKLWTQWRESWKMMESPTLMIAIIWSKGYIFQLAKSARAEPYPIQDRQKIIEMHKKGRSLAKICHHYRKVTMKDIDRWIGMAFVYTFFFSFRLDIFQKIHFESF